MWRPLVTSTVFGCLLAAPGVDQRSRSKRQTEGTGKCIDYEYAGFHCVPIYQCNNDGVIRTAAQGLFDPRSTSEDEVCGEFYDDYPEDCCPPDRTKASSGLCTASLDVCCLHPNSTAQYEEEYLDKFGCLPNGGSGPKIVDDSALSCTSQPDCELFGTKCCETAAPCVDDPDCLLFGTGCCEVPQPKDVCVPNEENCEIFGEDCCVGEPVECTEDDLLFGDCGTTSPPPPTTTPANPSSMTKPPQSTTPESPTTLDRFPRSEPSCGNRNPIGVDKVPVRPKAGEAKFGEWPHVCAVLKTEIIGGENPLKIYTGGASLIDYSIILTAAHPLEQIKDSDLIVRCGEWNTQNEDESQPFQERKVTKVVRHPDFDIGTLKYNFAVLFLESSFDAATHIAPVCLPQPCARYNKENCVANGWGKDKFGSDGKYASILKEVVYPVVSNKECQAKLRSTRLGKFFELDKSFMCAGGVKGVDTCKGDGGSPLTCKISGTNSWVQAGIVSWGIGCGEEGVPAVYANVAHVVCWIDHQVKKHYGDEGSSRFGFLPKVDCNGAEPTTDCR